MDVEAIAVVDLLCGGAGYLQGRGVGIGVSYRGSSTRTRNHESVLIRISSKNGLVEHVGEASNERMFIRHLSLVTRACMYAHMFMHVCVRMYTCAKCVRMHTHTDIPPHACTHKHAHAYIHTCTCARMCVYICTCARVCL